MASILADCNWQAPVAMPSDGKMYAWDEAAQAWAEIERVIA